MDENINFSVFEDQIYSQIISYNNSQKDLKSYIDSQVTSHELIELYLINDIWLNQWKQYSCYEEIKYNLPLKNINKLKELRAKTNSEQIILSNINNLSLFIINSNNNNEPNIEKINELAKFHIINKDCLQTLSLIRAIDKEIKIGFQIYHGKLMAKYYNQLIVLYKHNNRLNLILLIFKNAFEYLEEIYEQLKIIETYELLFNMGIDGDCEKQEILDGKIIFINKSFSNLKLEEEKIKNAISSLINLEINFYPNLISGGMNNLNMNLYLINEDWMEKFKKSLNYIDLNQNNGILNQNQDSNINKMVKAYKENPFALINETINEENNICNYLKENSTGNYIKLYSNYVLITEDLWNNLTRLFKWNMEIKVNIYIIKNSIIIIYNKKDFEFFELLNDKTKINHFFFHFHEDGRVEQIIQTMKKLGISEFFKKYNINLNQESPSNFKLIENNIYIGNAININTAKKNYDEYSLLINEQIQETEMIMGYNKENPMMSMMIQNNQNINNNDFNKENFNFVQNNINENKNIINDFNKFGSIDKNIANQDNNDLAYTENIFKNLNNNFTEKKQIYIHVKKQESNFLNRQFQNNNNALDINMPFNNNIVNNNNNFYNQKNTMANNNNFCSFNNMNNLQTNINYNFQPNVNNFNNNNFNNNINNNNNMNFGNNINSCINQGFHHMNSFAQSNMNNQNNNNCLNGLNSYDQMQNMFMQRNQNLMNNLMIGNVLLPRNDILKAIVLCLVNCKIFIENINTINTNQQNKPIINSLKYIFQNNDYNNCLSKLKENINKKLVQNIDLEDPKVVFVSIIENINSEIGGLNQNKTLEMSLAQYLNNEKVLYQEFVSQIFEPMNNTFISQNFFGIEEFYYKCKICGKMNYNFNIFKLIEFSVEDVNAFLVDKLKNYIANEKSERFMKIMRNNRQKIISLDDCFDYYTRKELKVCNIPCFQCQNVENSGNYKFMKVPNILFIAIKNKKNYSVSVELVDKLNIAVFSYIKQYELISAIIYSNKDEKYYALIKNGINGSWELHFENKQETIILPSVQNIGFPFLLIYQLKN